MLPDSLTIPFKILIWKEIRKNNIPGLKVNTKGIHDA